MERSRGPSRRAWLALGIGVAAAAAVGGTVYASADDEPVPDRERIRTDLAPLQRRFGEAGRLRGAHWLAYDQDAEGRSYLPSPDPRYRVVGVARLPAGAAARTAADPAHAFGPAGPTGVPEVLAAFLPAHARWLTSASYDALLLGPGPVDGLTRGRFFLDTATDTLYFDTVNPE
ncbi:hypothetical protein ABZZ04_03130 [Streptomyces sp. NPDC006435]|uniref:hypothetical protein n=1 Tax=Streptomyces sp. NPDC006435 TaxID=3154300 RepID=UPI0033AD37C5